MTKTSRHALEVMKKYRLSDRGIKMRKKWRTSKKGRISAKKTSARWYSTKHGKEVTKAISLRHYFGMSIDEYKDMLKKQNNRCAICGINFDDAYRGACVDHDHSSNKVRALLCQRCNHGIGFFTEDISKLQSAIDYLVKFGEGGG